MSLGLHLIISDINKYIYGKFTLERHKLSEDLPPSSQSSRTTGQIVKSKKIKNEQKCRRSKLTIDCTWFHYLLAELRSSPIYRQSFLKQQQSRFQCDQPIIILIVLQSTIVDLIDYNWNRRVYTLARERCELDHALSWLSTLGGAFSALGDHSTQCATTAGKISYHQLQLAMRLRDPLIAARCRLYFSLSMIQQHRFRLAERIVRAEYASNRCAAVPDEKLARMCQGIWSKLQYEHSCCRSVTVDGKRKELLLAKIVVGIKSL